MTVTTNKLSQEEEVAALLDRLLRTWLGEKIEALKAWHKNELWALSETLKHCQEVAIAALEAKHEAELEAQKEAWIKAQKLRVSAHVYGQHGTLYEME